MKGRLTTKTATILDLFADVSSVACTSGPRRPGQRGDGSDRKPTFTAWPDLRIADTTVSTQP